MHRLNFNRVMLLAGMGLGIPAELGMIGPPVKRHKSPRRKAYVGRTQSLIADRASSIQKLQRSPIPLLEPDERARKRHVHPRSKRNVA